MMTLLAVLVGFLLDLLFGDPLWLPHPTVAIGKAISLLEKQLRRLLPKTQRSELIGGSILVMLVTVFSWLVSFGILCVLGMIHPILRFAGESFMCYQILAMKCLRDEAVGVYQRILTGDVSLARTQVARIVGRDTASLSMECVIKAAVETVAENTSDGVIAPLLFLFLGGAPLGFFYKAINTMDSMVGYKNDRYLYFGRTAALVDDAANFIPARISGLLMVLVSPLCGLDGKAAWRVFRRDRKNHASPNSAQTESACAGAIGIQLAGDAVYFGKNVSKPTIGDDLRPPEAGDILKANRLLYGSSILFLLLGGLARMLAVLL